MVSKQKKATAGAGYVDLVRSILNRFPDRSRDIVLARFGIEGGKQHTLEEIGKNYHITRERVRQVIDAVLKHMKRHLAEREDVPLMQNLVTVIRNHGGIFALDELLEKKAGEDEAERGALRVLLMSMPGIKVLKETKDYRETVIVQDFSMNEWNKIIRAAVAVLEAKKDIMPLSELGTAVRAELQREDLSDESLANLLSPSLKIEQNVFGRFGLADWESVRPRGTRERAHLILKMMGKPLHFREIARLIDENGLSRKDKKTHPQTVHNELIKDKRFVLVGRGTYALSDWGYKRGTVREVLAEILREHKAPMSREELLSEIMKVRQVKKSTVIINLNSFFTKVGKNIYTLKGK